MKPAVTSKRNYGQTKLLVFNENESIMHKKVADLLSYFEPGDLLIVNRSGTMPGSLHAVIENSNQAVEIRLAAFQGRSASNLDDWAAISFGAGSWQDETEKRGAPAEIVVGDRLIFSEDLKAIVLDVHLKRVLKIKFVARNISQEILKLGSPIQYSYLKEELKIWDQQTVFSSAPLSAEPPSASFVIDWKLILGLKTKGVEVVTILHSAGISSSGDPEIDKMLPFDEFYELDLDVLDKIQKAKDAGHKVVALGTTVLRALESAARSGKARGLANYKIEPNSNIKTASVLFSGMHEPDSSHMKILKSFCSLGVLNNGYEQAIDSGYQGHEYGDVSLLDCRKRRSVEGPR